MAIKYNSNAAIVLESIMCRNLRAFVQAIIRYINTGKSADVRFGSTDKVGWSRSSENSSNSVTGSNGYHFMDLGHDTITLRRSYRDAGLPGENLSSRSSMQRANQCKLNCPHQ
jgi:elongation factor P